MRLWQHLLKQQVVAGAAAPTAWTFTYSSIYAGSSATQAALSDGNTETYWGSDGTEINGTYIFLQADFGSTKTLSSISYRIGPGSSGWDQSYTNGADLQHSLDGVSWTTATTISNADATTRTFTLPTPVQARYVRIASVRNNLIGAVNAYIAVSEFFFG